MMSCYEGLIELGRVLDDPLYKEAAERTAGSIRRDEINIAGSGAAFECWYGGKDKQTLPAYHTMETCVTFTYMQFCSRLWRDTGNPLYVEEFERTMYNALFASMKHDGGQIPSTVRWKDADSRVRSNAACTSTAAMPMVPGDSP